MPFPVPNFPNHSPELTGLSTDPQPYFFASSPALSPNDPHARIAVFDSGVGGLTVLREVYRQLPHESVLYVADTAHLPYGTRSQSEIIQFTREILTWLQQQHVKMVLMACNTSSALALETVQAEFAVPILGVILPGARAAVQQGSRIGVIATPATAASHAYRRAIAEINPSAQVWQIGCPEFVPLIEQNRLQDPYTFKVAQDYLTPLIDQQIDTLVYGCTHYPHLSPVIKTLLPSQVTLVDPAVHVVHAAAQELDVLGLRNTHPPLPTRFCVSGQIGQFVSLAHQWLGFSPQIEQIQVFDEADTRVCSASVDS
ncbi:glutamate racemase [Oscillatoria sp. FACHB-1407]|uniref:glutamate racemase n=1 Tax=Oscillatoria sp. FACHB-1407 TaxID=2692847 RepID=UPI001688F867|nr:glutamate racemase [Oscillatoria sp. FACHB-1407]MBD2463226.1 glutamate racemase [Oscillatoria sp. FACHB-1407]